MPQAVKRPPVSHADDSSFSSLLMGWAQQGFESFLATQRILMDFATNKTTSAIKTFQNGMTDLEHSPLAILTELAVEATANLTEAQRVLLNLVQQENDIVMGGVKDRFGSGTTAMVADRMRASIDTFIEMQQDFLTTASKHVQKRLQATKAGKGPDMACMIDAAREGMDDFVRAQKKFLDIVVEDGKGKTKDEPRKKAEVAKLAREAAAAFIDAQKKLLDLAGQQVNVNLQAVNHAVEMVDSLRPHLVPNITGEEIKNFVNAEKNVFTNIMKPESTSARHRAAKKPARKRTVRVAHAATA